MRQLALTWIAAWFGLGSVLAQTPPTAQFDCTHVDVRSLNGHWHLICDGQTVKDLGPNELDARDALQLIRNFHLNQFGAIGTPRPVLEYWLSDGQPPRGLAYNLQRMPFDAPTLRVESWQGQWCLRDSRQVLFVFGPHEADARQALDVLRRYGFNEVAYVGRTTPVMMLFLNDPDQVPLPAAPGKPADAKADLWGMHEFSNSLVPPGMLSVRQMSGVNPIQTAFLHGGDCQPIDWQQLAVHHDEQGWNLLAGTQCLANFGPREEDALVALNAVRYYRFTELATVGAGPAAFRLFLSSGQAPQGLLPGLKTVSFRPEALTVHQVQGTWKICQNGQPLIEGGEDADQTNAILQVIQHFQFDTLCQVGENGGMRFPIRRW